MAVKHEWRDVGAPYVQCDLTKAFAKLEPNRVIKLVAMKCACGEIAVKRITRKRFACAEHLSHTL